MFLHIQICIKFGKVHRSILFYYFNERICRLAHKLHIFTIIVEWEIHQTNLYKLLFVIFIWYGVCLLSRLLRLPGVTKKKKQDFIMQLRSNGCARFAMHKGPWQTEVPLAAKILYFLKWKRVLGAHHVPFTEALHKGPTNLATLLLLW